MADAGVVGAAFRFVVTGARGSAGFMKCSGLADEQGIVEYREGNSRSLANHQIPGIITSLKFTLEKGITGDAASFLAWRKQVKAGGTGFRSSINVRVNDCNGGSVLSVKAVNAWPSKVAVEDLDSMTSAVARISMEIVHEGLE